MPPICKDLAALEKLGRIFGCWRSTVARLAARRHAGFSRRFEGGSHDVSYVRKISDDASVSSDMRNARALEEI